jgi:hypothetical protein
LHYRRLVASSDSSNSRGTIKYIKKDDSDELPFLLLMIDFAVNYLLT